MNDETTQGLIAFIDKCLWDTINSNASKAQIKEILKNLRLLIEDYKKENEMKDDIKFVDTDIVPKEEIS